MKDAVIEYEILNWDKYNPRTDAKACSWFRFDASSPRHHILAGLDDKSFRVWVTLLCYAASGHGTSRQLVAMMSRELAIKWPRLSQCLEFLQDSEMIKYEMKLRSKKSPLRNERNVTERNVTSISHSLTLTPRSDPTEPIPKPEETVSEKKIKNDFSDAERSVIEYAETKLDRVVSETEAANFVTEWRQKPKLTPERIRKAIDWVAAHPLARIETRSIARLLHDSQARQAYFEWDKRIIRDVRQLLDMGMEAAEVVARMVEKCAPLDSEIFKTYLERICGQSKGEERQPDAI